MVSLLKVIDNPLQDIPLVAVIALQDLWDYDEIALAHIRKSSKNTSYYEAVCQFVSNFELQEVDYYDSKQQLVLKERLEGFLTLLNKWRDSANNESNFSANLGDLYGYSLLGIRSWTIQWCAKSCKLACFI